jgi:hypothetical protein
VVLGWFGQGEASVDEHITRKRYGKAIELLRAELQKRRNDRRLRMKLGDVLVLAGRKKEAIAVLTAVADEMALRGQAAQAIAVLKKVQAIQPGQPDVEEKLAYMIDQRSRPADSPWGQTGKGVILPENPAQELGFDEIGLESAPAPSTSPAPPPPLGEPPARAATPADLGLDLEAGTDTRAAGDLGPEDAVLSDETMRDALVSMIEETLRPGASPGSASVQDMTTVSLPQAPTPSWGVGETPLFRSFSQAELVALIKGLRLLSFEAGQIVVSEGEMGGSLFVVTSGALRAFVKSPAGRNVEVRQIEEGEFFGEISVLTGQARSATITAATRCELLELDRATLDSISASHPHVRQVLQEFYEQRRADSLETLVRQMGAAPA